MPRRSRTRQGVIRVFGYALIACAIVASVIGARAAIALVTVLPSFSATQSLETDLAPVSIVISDLNGDDKPDLATANSRQQRLGLHQLGDATSRPTRLPRSAEPPSLAIGDVNGDRSPDLVTRTTRAPSPCSLT